MGARVVLETGHASFAQKAKLVVHVAAVDTALMIFRERKRSKQVNFEVQVRTTQTQEWDMAESFTINPEFRDLLDGLRSDERSGLEASIKADGCRDALIVWAEKGILVDGHNRYAICNDLGITPRIELKHFASHEDVLLWIIDNQMSRRNITEARRIALALRREPILAAKAKARQGERNDLKATSGSKDPEVKTPKPASHATRNAIAKAADSSGTNVQRVKAVLANADDVVKEKMLSGEMKIRTAYDTVKTQRTTVAPSEPPQVETIFVKPHREQQASKSGPRKMSTGVGIERAHAAIAELRRIPPSDPERDQGHEIVAGYLRACKLQTKK